MSAYDPIAPFYHQRWAERFHPQALNMLQPFLQRCPSGSRLVDMCCGSGGVSNRVRSMGFDVTGFDGSLGLLRQAPSGALVCADARALPFRTATFDGAYATFDIPNHLLDPADLQGVFCAVRGILKPGAGLFFDVLLEEAYLEAWTQMGANVEEDYAFFVRGGYDRVTRLAFTDVTTFELKEGGWTRNDARVRERYYPPQDVRRMLELAGFEDIQTYPLTGTDAFSFGRAVFSAYAG